MEKSSPSMIIIKFILSIVAISMGVITGFYLGTNYKDVDLKQLVNKFNKSKFQYEYKKETTFSDKPNVKKLAEECFSEEFKCNQEVTLDNGKTKLKLNISTDRNAYNLLATRIIYDNSTIFEDDYIIISKIALLDNNILVFDYKNQKVLVDTIWYHRTFYSLNNKELKTITIKDDWISDLETTDSITSKRTTYYSYNNNDIDYDNNLVDVTKKEITLLDDGTILDTELQKLKTRYTGTQLIIEENPKEDEIIDDDTLHHDINPKDTDSLKYTLNECYNKNNSCSINYVLSNINYQEPITVNNERLDNNIRYITVLYKNNIIFKTIDTFLDTATIESISLLDNNILVIDYYNNKEFIKTQKHYRFYYSLNNNIYKNIITYDEKLSNIYDSNYDYTNTNTSKDIIYYETKNIDYETKKETILKRNLILKENGFLENKIIEEIEIDYTESQD